MEKITLNEDVTAIIGANEYIILCKLIRLHNELCKNKTFDGLFTFPISRLSALANISEATVSRTLNCLKNSGILERSQFDGGYSYINKLDSQAIKKLNSDAKNKKLEYYDGLNHSRSKRFKTKKTINEIYKKTTKENSFI